MVLDGLSGLYGLKYDSATACGLPLYLCSYKLVGSATCPNHLDSLVYKLFPMLLGIFFFIYVTIAPQIVFSINVNLLSDLRGELQTTHVEGWKSTEN